MNTQLYSLLLCTNGALEGRPALEYGVWLADLLRLPVTLLGIVENPLQDAEVQQVLQEVQAHLTSAGIAHTTLVRTGSAQEVICAEADPAHHLAVSGPMGRPQWRRWLKGSTFRRMIPNLRAPLIYTPTAHRQLSHILLSTGALDYAISAECWALHLAQRTGASLTILHVTEAVHYHYPIARQIETHRKDLLTTDIPQARHLRALLEQAQTQGLATTLLVRQGTVVHEIIAEARGGQYDLVVMGTKHSSRSLRRQYLPDVAAEVMETIKIPVLVVRAGQACVLSTQLPETSANESVFIS